MAAPATVMSSQDDGEEHPSTPSGAHPVPLDPPVADATKTDGEEEGTRPAAARRWQTERPKFVSKFTSRAARAHPAGPKRYGTTTSALNQAIWSNQNADDSSSTSSSDDDAERNDKQRRTAKARSGPSQGSYSRFSAGNENFRTKGRVSRRDGRLNISVNETNNRGYLAKALGADFFKTYEPEPAKGSADAPSRHSGDASQASLPIEIPRPKLSIVIMVIGSRGDIQPFLKIGKCLKECGHRVRIATHPAFRDFVQKDSGLEFFSVGGDPSELMAFMVKNPDMIPSMDTILGGEIGRRRAQMAEMFEGFWRACINEFDNEENASNVRMMEKKAPFIADAIIANPPSFAHIHCAERLGIPLHLMFTFPYTPTQAFPHPLANIKKSNVDPGYLNFMSYPLVETMTWSGLGDLVNNFRKNTLGLEPVSTLWAPGQLYRLKVPYTYLWSPGLVSKPKDWGPEIDIAGFVFLDLASTFEPPKDLVEFLDAGEPPVYIGFGSIVVDKPEEFTKMIFEAVEKAGVRALVSKGWGGLGEGNVPSSVYMLENTPHDWLFPKVSAVVHHGGAGTTAIGLKCGKPTMIVPFFGDQQFWGAMIGESGAGAMPIPHKDLTADKLAEGIKQCLTEEARTAAKKYAEDIEAEGDGAKNATTSFHRSLVLRGQHSMRCSILEDRVAVWSLKNTQLRLSALAAELLVEKKRLSWKQLRLIRHTEWNDFEGPGEPITGIASAVAGTATNIVAGVGSVPFKIAKTRKRRSMHEKRKGRKSEEVARSQNRNPSTNGGKTDRLHSSSDEHTNMDNKNTEGRPSDGDNARASTTKVGEESGHKKILAPITSGHTISGEPVLSDKDAKHEAEHEEDSSDTSENPNENVMEEVAQDVGAGFGKTAEAIAKVPMDLSLAIAQGFHNAPRLYGDNTVRRPTRITGMKSGLKAAGKEFAYGVYDGVSGLVAQPYTGARDHGATGFVKGVGMGLTGFVLKDLAAIFGPFGYTFKGIHKELQKAKQPTRFIRKARMLEGQLDLQALDEKQSKQTLETVLHGWSVVQEVWAIMEEKRSKGLVGKYQAVRERKAWRAKGAFENVQMAERAVEATKQGLPLDSIFAEQERQLELSHRPRKNVADELQKGGSKEIDDQNQVVQANGRARSPVPK